MGGVMLMLATLGFPVLLLALTLLMERVERPLRTELTFDDVVVVLAEARPEELERLVSEGYAPTVERYWRRRRRAQLLLPLRGGSR